MKFMSTAQLVLFSAFMTLSHIGHSEPWPGYGRTMPVSTYDKDEAYNPSYQFGQFKTFRAYQDPNFTVGLRLPSPMLNPDYQAYNIIIVINDNETNVNSQMFGPLQTMRVYAKHANNSQKLLYFWNISTGIDTASTKKGVYRPQRFSSRHWSGSYDAPMLSSVFFDAGRALHSSISTDDLYLMGKKRSSHGCVHVEDNRAEELFHLIGHSGYGKVDLIDHKGKIVKDAEGKAKKVSSYKTLIIIN